MFDHKNLLSIDELSAEDIMTVLTYAKTFEEVNERPIKKVPALRGKTICNLFLEPSTRTRVFPAIRSTQVVRPLPR